MEQFIADGYLVKALNLPEEYADQILQPKTPEKDESETTETEAVLNPNFKPKPDRINPNAPITLHERIGQILHLSEAVIRDTNECANLDRLPETILLRARGCLWLAMLYELFSLLEPESINVPMLTRLSQSNMQGFFCVCQWHCVYDSEQIHLCHLRTKHPQVHKAMLIVRKSVDPYEYEQFSFKPNSFVNAEQVTELKRRLCRLATVRKRLPLLKDEREEIVKRRKYRNEYVKSED